MTERKFAAYSIRFTPEELERLRARSRREQRPISTIIRRALQHECNGLGNVTLTASGGIITLDDRDNGMPL